MYDEQEQKKFFDKNKEVHDLANSQQWAMIKVRLFEKIDDLQSVMNVDMENPEQTFQDIKTRKNVIDVLVELMKEVDGEARQFEENELTPDETGFVRRT